MLYIRKMTLDLIYSRQLIRYSSVITTICLQMLQIIVIFFSGNQIKNRMK